MIGAGIDEIYKAGATVKLGEEDGGVSLGFRVLDPLQTRSNAAALVTSFS